jgi:hypothetical protein
MKYLGKIKMGECHSKMPGEVKANMGKKISALKKKRAKYTKRKKVLNKIAAVAIKLREKHLEKVEVTPSASQTSQN